MEKVGPRVGVYGRQRDDFERETRATTTTEALPSGGEALAKRGKVHSAKRRGAVKAKSSDQELRRQYAHCETIPNNRM